MSQITIAKQIYRELLQGKITVETAQERIDKLNIKSQEIDEIEIAIVPDDIIYVLQKFLSGKLQSEYLLDWSSFLIIENVFVDPEWIYDPYSDSYEPIWWVLQQLTCPAIDGAITFTRVKELAKYLEDLKKILQTH